MKAVVIDQFGPSSVLQVRDVKRPTIGPNQALVEVHASSVNPIDWKLRDGQMRSFFKLDFPKILGADIAGIVAEIGESVSRFKVGDAVMGHSMASTGGAYAEFIALDASNLSSKPKSLSFDEAAAIPLAGTTALQCLRDCGQVKPGDRVLVIGGSGGVGTFAVQIAKAMGAHVTSVCSTANVDLVSSLGADKVIDYTTQDALETDQFYDVIYDTIGLQKIDDARAVLSDHGVYVTLVPGEGIAFFTPGETERADQGGYFLMCTPSGKDQDVLGEWVEQGKLRPVIDSVYTLDQIDQAHARSETLRAKGKIIIKVK